MSAQSVHFFVWKTDYQEPSRSRRPRSSLACKKKENILQWPRPAFLIPGVFDNQPSPLMEVTNHADDAIDGGFNPVGDFSPIVDTVLGFNSNTTAYCAFDETFRNINLSEWKKMTCSQRMTAYEHYSCQGVQLEEKKVKCGGKKCSNCRDAFRHYRKPCAEPSWLSFLVCVTKQEDVYINAISQAASHKIHPPDNKQQYIDNAPPKRKAKAKRTVWGEDSNNTHTFGEIMDSNDDDEMNHLQLLWNTTAEALLPCPSGSK